MQGAHSLHGCYLTGPNSVCMLWTNMPSCVSAVWSLTGFLIVKEKEWKTLAWQNRGGVVFKIKRTVSADSTVYQHAFCGSLLSAMQMMQQTCAICRTLLRQYRLFEMPKMCSTTLCFWICAGL